MVDFQTFDLTHSWGDPTRMFALSATLINAAEGYVIALQQQAATLVAPVINVDFPTVDNAPIPVTAPLPTMLTPPSFATLPSLPVDPNASFSYTEPLMYTSALLSQLQTNLLNALTDGSYTTLTAQAQQAIWDAAREREYRQQVDALAELDRMESLGYAFPPGTFVDARLKMQTETNNTLAGVSREIMAKQAEMQLENIVKAREASSELEGKFLTYANAIADRTLGAAKTRLEAVIEIYQAKISGFDALVKAYASEATAAAEFNRAQAEVYHAEIEGISSYNETLTKQWEAVINEQEKITEIAVSAEKANGDLYIATRGLSQDASTHAAQVNAQLGAAALGAISWHSGISQSLSESQSESDSTSRSTSTSQSTSFSTSTSDITEQIASV